MRKLISNNREQGAIYEDGGKNKIIKSRNKIVTWGLKIHLKDIDDGAVHFCILFIWTMDNVQINKIQRKHGDYFNNSDFVTF
jgi:hypothetical protein